jgi:histidine triad (HIT) family protein
VSDCLFCRIARGEIPAKLVHEDDEVLAFRDINPQAPTHVLVIPRRHVPRLSEATPEDAPLLGRVLETAARVARAEGLTDFRAVLNDGPGAGQSVFHVHVHLLGGRPLAWPPG